MNRGDPLSRYTHPQRNQLFPNVIDDFSDVVQRSPEEAIAQAMTATFRTDENASFAPIVADLFLYSDAELRVGLLNILMRYVGRDTIRVLSNAGLFGLDPDSRQVYEETATQLSPEAIGIIAAEAEQQDSSVVDKVSALYAQHTAVVSKLGAPVVATVLAQIAQCASRDLDLWLTIQSDSVRSV